MAEFDALTKKVLKVRSELEGARLRKITTNVAVRSKAIANQAIAPKTLSHYGRKAVTVQARFDVVDDGTAVIKPKPAGLTALLEKGSGSTWKSPKRKGSARRKRGTVGSYQRRPVYGRGAWSKGMDAMRPKVAEFVHNEVVRALGEVF